MDDRLEGLESYGRAESAQETNTRLGRMEGKLDALEQDVKELYSMISELKTTILATDKRSTQQGPYCTHRRVCQAIIKTNRYTILIISL